MSASVRSEGAERGDGNGLHHQRAFHRRLLQHHSARRCRRDDCGGTEAAITPMGVGGFAAMRALSTRNDDPEHACRPWDKDRDGFVVGEGAGILILEELEFAKARGATILAEIVGYGMSADAYHITSRRRRRRRRLPRDAQRASRCARSQPDDVGYVNAHGTSTPLGDELETAAIKRALRRAREASCR